MPRCLLLAARGDGGTVGAGGGPGAAGDCSMHEGLAHQLLGKHQGRVCRRTGGPRQAPSCAPPGQSSCIRWHLSICKGAAECLCFRQHALPCQVIEREQRHSQIWREIHTEREREEIMKIL